ncbi:MAG: NfeD family protein [Planctomycetota bacterium]
MSWLPFALLALGLFLLVCEVFFPSLGLLGTLAAAAIVGGGFVAYHESVLFGYVALAFVLVPAVLGIAFKYFPQTPFGRKFTLRGTSFAKDEARAAERGLGELIGQEGIVETTLRPAGIAVIGERRVDVVSRGKHIDSGARVRVIKVEGNRVIVDLTQDHRNA